MSLEKEKEKSKILSIGYEKLCNCEENHINCLTAKEWLKSQIGVWQFYYEKRDIRDKQLHPATYPIALAKKCIELFTHEGELVLDPFVGSGTTLVAAQDINRNAVGFDLQQKYINLSNDRLKHQHIFSQNTKRIAICDDARNIPKYFKEKTIKLVLTSPPYAQLLNRKRKNKSRRGEQRKNYQYGINEQYSQDERDLGILGRDNFKEALKEIFIGIIPLIKEKGHCVVNVPDYWWKGKRIPLHIDVIEALETAGFEFRNTIIWDRTNIVNQVGIFGWPSNYITMGATFEYLLHFLKPEEMD
jgi:DNA modification methylase